MYVFKEDEYSPISQNNEEFDIDTSLLQQLVMIHTNNDRNDKLNNYREKIFNSTYQSTPISFIREKLINSKKPSTNASNKKVNGEKFSGERLWSESCKNSLLKPKYKLKIYNKNLTRKLEKLKSSLK